ncbi:uncharacterized protein [Tiliqua scincoides]|uniref:uncharacterized protein n=1 Tax=Tiliqua scincoides TaxID=71010 RepID=UPI00346332AC
MPPNIMPSHLTSPSSKRLSIVCCDLYGLEMAKILPQESSRPILAGKLNAATMLFDRLVRVTMAWLKKWLCLWKSFPATLMKAVFMGIAKWAYRVALAAAPLEKQEVIQRNEEMHNLKDGHLEHLILSSLESLVEDGHLGESHKQLLNGSNSTRMEDECMFEQCVINSSISFDTETNWEDSSEEDMGLDNMEGPKKFSQTWLEDCCNPQIFTKSLGISGYFGENLRDSHTHPRKIMDVKGSFCQGLGSPSVSWEHREGLESSGDFATHKEQSTDNSADLPECGKHLESDRKDEDKGSLNLGAPTISHGFKSPLVLSLFYCPSEDEDDDEGDDEDWWSEDEREESCQSQTFLDGGNSEKEEKPLEVGDHPLHQNALERLSEPICQNNNPSYLVCSSKPIQVLRAPAVASSEPQTHKEIKVSFYLTKMDSKPEEFCNPPKHPRTPKDPRANCRHLAHECNLLSSRKKCDPITTETPSVSQEQSPVIKKVRFSPVVTIHNLIVWDYASRAARRGPWEEMARDRSRFSRRIAEVGAVLEPCLEKDHRAKAWRNMHGVLNAPDDNTTRAGKQRVRKES